MIFQILASQIADVVESGKLGQLLWVILAAETLCFKKTILQQQQRTRDLDIAPERCTFRSSLKCKISFSRNGQAVSTCDTMDCT